MIGGRRSWVDLAPPFRRRCVVFDRRERPIRLIAAVELTGLCRGEPAPGLTALMEGEVCYALYAKPNDAMKIGRTRQLLTRWGRIETASGMKLQLVAVWQCADGTTMESRLHERYAASRTLGEWFRAGDVIVDLRQRANVRPRRPDEQIARDVQPLRR